MFNPPQPPRSKFSAVAITLIIFVCSAGAGVAYLFMTDQTPSWLSFLIPSSSYTSSEQESKATAPPGTSPSLKTADSGLSASTPAAEKGASPASSGKVARPPSREASDSGETQAVAPPAGQAAPSAPADSGDSTHPVISYGKGKSVGNNGTMVRGQIPDGQGLSGVAPQPPSEPAQHGGLASSPENQVVPFAILGDMAKFLTSNYWPAGSHPMARDRAITTATLKWANVKYGSQLQGFGASGATIAAKRKHVLDYVFTPTMINALYNMYAQRFFETFDKEARAQLRGPERKPLDSAQLGDMYDVYAVASQGLVEAIYAYIYTPNVRELVAEYAVAATEASEAYKLFAANLQNGNGSNVEIARRYQNAITDRDQKRGALAAALQQNGAPKAMDADSLAYIAQWLFRRGDNNTDCLTALANVVHSCALTFRSIGTQYDDLAVSQGLR